MRQGKLLIWLTQLGISVAAPLGGFIFLAAWLRRRFGLGAWVVIVGVVLGIFGAVDGLWMSLKAMERMAEDKKEDEAPLAFDDHD